MRMTKTFLAATFLITPLANAYAQSPGWYLGAAVGQSQAKETCDGLPVPCDDKDTAWRVFGGYQFNAFLGAELGYVDMGTPASASGTVSGIPRTARTEVTAWDLVAIASYPIGRFSIYGALGLYRAETDTSASVGATPIDINETNVDLTFGLGATFAITKNLVVRGEWRRYKDVGGDQGGEDHVDVLSAAVIWHF